MRVPTPPRGARIASALLAALALVAAYASSRAQETRPPGIAAPVRSPDVPFEPTPRSIVREMLRLAEVRATDRVYDLGCGDGRIVITAVKEFGARGVCVDIDPLRIAESRESARRAGVTDRITFRTQDLFKTELREATVVTLFLWPHVNLRLKPRLLSELRPGTRVVSYMHDMGDWVPEKARPAGRRHRIYLWTIPGAS
jgi:SAM-dependent methyltransferase